MFNQILLEIYCGKKFDNNLEYSFPCYCPNKDSIPNYLCILNKCPFCVFAPCENSLCFINDKSEAEEIISFGGEMLGDFIDNADAKKIWKTIAVNKINEAYDAYMKEIQKIEDDSLS